MEEKDKRKEWKNPVLHFQPRISGNSALLLTSCCGHPLQRDLVAWFVHGSCMHPAT